VAPPTRPRKSRRRKDLENAVSRGAVRVLRALAMALPHRAAMRVAGVVGVLVYRVCFWWRRVAERQLTEAFPEWPLYRVRGTARLVFVNFAKTMFEFMRSRRVEPDAFRRLNRLHGYEHIARAMEAGRPAILLAAHYDNWEWVGRRLVMEGATVSVIARSQDDPLLTRLIDDTRASGGLRVVDRDDVRGALRALRNGEALGIVPDQNVIAGGVFVEFFGKPAATVVGPYRMAKRFDAVVLHALSRRRPDDTHDVHIFPAELPEPTGDDETDVAAWTQAWTRGLERWIRHTPEQWLWFHKRWRTQPDSAPPTDTMAEAE